MTSFAVNSRSKLDPENNEESNRKADDEIVHNLDYQRLEYVMHGKENPVLAPFSKEYLNVNEAIQSHKTKNFATTYQLSRDFYDRAQVYEERQRNVSPFSLSLKTQYI